MTAWLGSDECSFFDRPPCSNLSRRPGDLLSRETTMALAGEGAICIWNDILPEHRTDFYALAQ